MSQRDRSILLRFMLGESVESIRRCCCVATFGQRGVERARHLPAGLVERIVREEITRLRALARLEVRK